jgi:hypothetical protein
MGFNEHTTSLSNRTSQLFDDLSSKFLVVSSNFAVGSDCINHSVLDHTKEQQNRYNPDPDLRSGCGSFGYCNPLIIHSLINEPVGRPSGRHAFYTLGA